MIKKFCYLLFMSMLLFLAPAVSMAENPVQIDVLYMDHGPMQPTLRKLRALFPAYGNRLAVSWHNFESQEAEGFKSKMGIKQHTPLVIWIDGKSQWTSNGHTITFEGFPTGSGPSFFQGQWTIEDLSAILDQIAGKH